MRDHVESVRAAAIAAGDGAPAAREPIAQPAISNYAIIGDCRTAALVSSGGSVDWLCLPRFDGASVFAALLDTERGGRFHVRPATPFRSHRRYLPDSPVLETTFETEGGRVTVLDLMVVETDASRGRALTPDHELLRRIECTAGDVEVDVLFDPRPGYGARTPRLHDHQPLGFFFFDGADSFVIRSDLALEPRRGAPGVAGRTRLGRGDVRWISMTTEHGLPAVLQPLGDEASARLERTVAWWNAWCSACSYEGEYRELVTRSALTLKLLTFPPSGAILAAPTTSLPERVGGERNWDYRYCWLRDASMTLRVLLDVGYPDEAEAFLAWLLHATRLTSPELQVLYDVYGRTHHPERTLPWLAGYRGSRPVRTGNAATTQLQLDIYGELIGAAYEFVRHGGKLDAAEARMLSGLGGVVCKRWREPDNGIWEPRHEPQHNTFSKAMCWVALHRLLELSEHDHIDIDLDPAMLRRECDTIRNEIRTRGVDPRTGAYRAIFDGDAAIDASLLLLGIAGYDDPDSDAMRRTLEIVRARLGRNGLLFRYRYDDGFPAPEQGTFGICTFWEVELLARQGRLDEAHQVFSRMIDCANDAGLFSEEVDPDTGELLGNFPQAFTHVGLISAAAAIARAEGRPPEARAQAPSGTQAKTGEQQTATAEMAAK